MAANSYAYNYKQTERITTNHHQQQQQETVRMEKEKEREKKNINDNGRSWRSKMIYANDSSRQTINWINGSATTGAGSSIDAVLIGMICMWCVCVRLCLCDKISIQFSPVDVIFYHTVDKMQRVAHLICIWNAFQRLLTPFNGWITLIFVINDIECAIFVQHALYSVHEHINLNIVTFRTEIVHKCPRKPERRKKKIEIEQHIYETLL